MDEFFTNLMNPDNAFGHVNYILIILSVSMSSMRWLRVFAIASGITGVIYYGFIVSDEISAMWETIFTSVNVIQLAIILLASRRRSTSEDEQFFIDTVMPNLEGNLRARMLKLARWQTKEPGEVLVEEGEAKPQLVFIARGAASVERGGNIVGVCGPGDFLGEMSFLTGKPASATVRVANETRCCVFDPGVLRILTDKNPGIRQSLEVSFNRNLVGKLERMNEANRAASKPAVAEAAAKTPAEGSTETDPAPPVT
ncbi:Crp/Fnr family transcriptional regulator [Mesorhizobium sp. 10J20-29]